MGRTTNHADIIPASMINRRNAPTAAGPRTRSKISLFLGIPNPFCLVLALAFKK
jgi:hypothetical protein